MQFFYLATHHRSNTNITSDPDLILAVVAEMVRRGKQVLVVPYSITPAEYDALGDKHPENFDPVAIADWISIVP